MIYSCFCHDLSVLRCKLMSSEDSNDPSEMGQASAYAQLLKQIESLKIELGSLKSELDFKTAQISRLELEAACLKVSQVEFFRVVSR